MVPDNTNECPSTGQLSGVRNIFTCFIMTLLSTFPLYLYDDVTTSSLIRYTPTFTSLCFLHLPSFTVFPLTSPPDSTYRKFLHLRFVSFTLLCSFHLNLVSPVFVYSIHPYYCPFKRLSPLSTEFCFLHLSPFPSPPLKSLRTNLLHTVPPHRVSSLPFSSSFLRPLHLLHLTADQNDPTLPLWVVTC